MSEFTPASPHMDDAMRLRAAPAASWGAILAGAIVAVAVSLILVTLGSGLGFASISPWSGHGLSAGSFTVLGAVWLIVTQWLSAAVGGYIAGRLRHRWLATHPHEVFFRDTAHGLVTWAVATLIVVAVVTSSATALIGGGAHAAAGMASMGAHGVADMHPMDMGMNRGSEAAGGTPGAYDVDKLLRPAAPANTSGAPSTNQSAEMGSGHGGNAGHGDDSRMEVAHIAATAAINGNIADDDRSYLTNLVAAHTGVSTDEAQKRVDAFVQSVNEATAKAKAAADKARKAAATAALYTALSLLIGAFIASVSAALGGRLRDEHQ